MATLSLSSQYELLGLPRSSYYYEPVDVSEQNLELMRRINEIHLQHPYFGAPRMTRRLSTPDAPVNKKRIRRLMRLMGIEAQLSFCLQAERAIIKNED